MSTGCLSAQSHLNKVRKNLLATSHATNLLVDISPAEAFAYIAGHAMLHRPTVDMGGAVYAPKKSLLSGYFPFKIFTLLIIARSSGYLATRFRCGYYQYN